MKEAEAVFHRLAGNARSLSFYVDFAVANYREPEKQKLLVDAVAEYVAAKEHEFEQDHTRSKNFQWSSAILKNAG